MKLEAKIWKDGKFWVIAIPALDASTQGYSRKEALEMVASLVEEMAELEGFKAHAELQSPGQVVISTNDTAALIALVLYRQREKSGLTVLEASRRLGSNSPNAFGAYEQGKRAPSMEQFEKLIKALDPSADIILKVG